MSLSDRLSKMEVREEQLLPGSGGMCLEAFLKSQGGYHAHD